MVPHLPGPHPHPLHGPGNVFWADESGWETLFSVSGTGSAAEWGTGRKMTQASWCLHHWDQQQRCFDIVKTFLFLLSRTTSFGVPLWFKGALFFFYWVIRLKELTWFTQQQPIWNAWVVANSAVLGYVSFFPQGSQSPGLGDFSSCVADRKQAQGGWAGCLWWSISGQRGYSVPILFLLLWPVWCSWGFVQHDLCLCFWGKWSIS